MFRFHLKYSGFKKKKKKKEKKSLRRGQKQGLFPYKFMPLLNYISLLIIYYLSTLREVHDIARFLIYTEFPRAFGQETRVKSFFFPFKKRLTW